MNQRNNVIILVRYSIPISPYSTIDDKGARYNCFVIENLIVAVNTFDVKRGLHMLTVQESLSNIEGKCVWGKHNPTS